MPGEGAEFTLQMCPSNSQKINNIHYRYSQRVIGLLMA